MYPGWAQEGVGVQGALLVLMVLLMLVVVVVVVQVQVQSVLR